MYFRSQKKSSQDVSLSDYIETGTDGAALSLMDVVSDEEDLLDRVSDRQSLKTLCTAIDSILTPQERQVVILRYGLAGTKPHRQREVAKATGISRSYVSRIEKRALEKLREVLENQRQFFVSPKESDLITAQTAALLSEAIEQAFSLE